MIQNIFRGILENRIRAADMARISQLAEIPICKIVKNSGFIALSFLILSGFLFITGVCQLLARLLFVTENPLFIRIYNLLDFICFV